MKSRNFLTKSKKSGHRYYYGKACYQKCWLAFRLINCPGSFSIFKIIVYGFLGKIGSDIIQYEALNEPTLTADPSIIKDYFNPSLTKEVRYLINEIHGNNSRNNVYFTFKYLWPENAVLRTIEQSGHAKQHETVISSGGNELEQFFNQFKRVFSQSPKHHKGKRSGDYESPLSCLKHDDTVPQQYLDNAVKAGKKCYAYDDDNQVYIVFQRTENNVYHGYDEINVNKVPAQARIALKKRKNGGSA